MDVTSIFFNFCILHSSQTGNDFLKNQQFNRFLQRTLFGRCIFCGHTIKVTFFGKSLTILIKDISSVHVKKEESHSGNGNQSLDSTNEADGFQLKSNLDSKMLQNHNLTEDSLSSNSSSPLSPEAYRSSTRDSSKVDDINESLDKLRLSDSGRQTSTPKRSSRATSRRKDEERHLVTGNGNVEAPEMFRITSSTALVFAKTGKEKKEKGRQLKQVSFDDIGGMKKHLKSLREMIEVPLKNPSLFLSVG